MNDPLLTSAQVARLLGVASATVKRWADHGLIPCARTAGAHRRFRTEDVERFARAHAGGAPAEEEVLADRLLEATEPFALHGLLVAERSRAGGWWPVADALARATRVIGERWAAGRVTVLEEHAASERLSRALAWVSESLPVKADAPRVLLASATGDEHTLGLALAEVAIREHGWATAWAGRGAPPGELAAALVRRDAEVLGLSASAASAPTVLAAEVAQLAPAVLSSGAGLLLGGSGPWPEAPAAGVRVRAFSELRAALDAREPAGAGGAAPPAGSPSTLDRRGDAG